ncbi:MAG: hypothetical protein WBC33_06620, partial [Conexibacter sp.]
DVARDLDRGVPTMPPIPPGLDQQLANMPSVPGQPISSPPGGPQIPIPINEDPIEQYARELFWTFMERVPTIPEVQALAQAGGTREGVLAIVLASAEWANVVNDLYLELLGRDADPGGLAANMQNLGGKAAVRAAIMSSPEYQQRHGV